MTDKLSPSQLIGILALVALIWLASNALAALIALSAFWLERATYAYLSARAELTGPRIIIACAILSWPLFGLIAACFPPETVCHKHHHKMICTTS